MKTASLPAALALCLALCLSSLPSFAEESRFVGTWVLDAAKSNAPAASGTATLVISDLGGGKYKSVSDTTVAGQTAHSEITFAIDGKDYVAETTPAMPGGLQVVQSFEKAGDGYKQTLKVSGQLVATTVATVSADGKTLTLTATPAGAPASTALVFARR
ncbi:MAG TPA: hypothetical protein VFX89_00175 [Gammaproteobacteria bacterium]|nr:hypothetical protein [Gammaproteobacteria bacterium]